ncbi:MAG: tetratricopeptide repeat protein [Polyangiaceae bacterium]
MRAYVVTGLGTFALGASLFACGGPAGAVGEAVRPKAATGHEAMGEANIAACAKAVAGEPLVVDLKSNERSDLEVAIKDGVAVVSFDCKNLKILKGCSAPGSYRFAGVTRKEDVVRMTNADELAANLPLTGAQLAGEMKRGSTLDLALVTVGKKRTTASEITRPELTGGGTCDSATHVVRGVYVGAFALATGTEGEVKAVAQIFGAGTSAQSSSAKKTEARDGDLEACRKSSPDANEPPAQCAAVTRLELVPIVAAKKTAEESKQQEAQADTPACPSGFTWGGTKCVSGKAAQKACDRETGTPEECAAACNAGNAESCFNLAVYASEPARTITEPGGKTRTTRFASPNPDLAMLEKACALGHGVSCSRAANTYIAKTYAPKTTEAERVKAGERATKLHTAGCNLGEPHSCVAMAEAFDPSSAERPGTTKSADKHLAFTRRACDLGLGYACGRLGDMHRDGKGGAKEDSKLAIEAYERQCSSGGFSDGDGCYKIGAIYANGKGLPVDKDKALTHLERACNLHSMFACMAGRELALESKDTTRARSFLERGCTKDVRGWDTCLALGEAYEKGQLGLQKDFAKAAESYELGCAKGACKRAGDLYKSGGQGLSPSPDKALHAYTQGCNFFGDSQACAGVEAVLKTKSKPELVEFYTLRCESRGDARACVKLKAAGGTPKDETVKRYAEYAQSQCQKLHYGDECKLWKDLGGSPTAKELAQPTREAEEKKRADEAKKAAGTKAKK